MNVEEIVELKAEIYVSHAAAAAAMAEWIPLIFDAGTQTVVYQHEDVRDRRFAGKNMERLPHLRALLFNRTA